MSDGPNGSGDDAGDGPAYDVDFGAEDDVVGMDVARISHSIV
jgi:hypothetical protein